MRFGFAVVLAVVLSCAANVYAAETPKLSEQDKKTVAKCLVDLKSDTFDVRQAAEKQLGSLSVATVPLLRDALKNSADADFTSSLHRVLKHWALETETDPVVLAGYAKEEAEAKNFPVAAKYYEKTATLFAKQAEQEKDKTKKDELTTLAAKATERSKRAEMRTQVKIQGNPVMVVGGGGNVANVKLTVSVNGKDSVDVMKEDW